jgi:hypothetical protein
MCTLSFLRLKSGYSFMMNRDESPARPKPEQIRQASIEGVDGAVRRVLYPVDPGSNGTWIGTNDQGVVLALMNQYPAGYQRPSGALSRGRLIPEGLRAGTAITALERVAAMDLKSTPPFLLVGVDEQGAPLSLGWDGQHWERKLYPDGALELSSSGYQPNEVLPVREAQFDLMLQSVEGKDEAEVLAAQEAYHFSQEPEPGPLAVWMTRPDSRTVSFVHCLVLPKKAHFRYIDREAHEAQEGPVALQLAR